jgi:hypothetical protein
MYAFRPYGASENLADGSSINISPLAGLQTFANGIDILITAP